MRLRHPSTPRLCAMPHRGTAPLMGNRAVLPLCVKPCERIGSLTRAERYQIKRLQPSPRFHAEALPACTLVACGPCTRLAAGDDTGMTARRVPAPSSQQETAAQYRQSARGDALPQIKAEHGSNGRAQCVRAPRFCMGTIAMVPMLCVGTSPWTLRVHRPPERRAHAGMWARSIRCSAGASPAGWLLQTSADHPFSVSRESSRRWPWWSSCRRSSAPALPRHRTARCRRRPRRRGRSRHP